MSEIMLLAAVAVCVYVFGRRVRIMMHPNVKNLSASEALQLMKENKELVILDVRTPAEYGEGHIPGAILIPAHELARRIAELDQTKPILVYCASGGRSPGAVGVLLKAHFLEIYHLTRGLMGWTGSLQNR